jgi:HK97 family phage portal protein
MGWLDGSNAAKQTTVLDGTQNFINLPALGGRPNLSGVIEPDGSYEVFSSAGYGRNELVYACIALRAESLPQSQLKVYPTGPSNRALDDHPIRRLIERPNELISEFDLFELLVTYRDLAGICYTMVVPGRDGTPSELWPLRPDLVGVLPSSRDPRDYTWVYRPNPERPDIQVLIPRQQMIVAKYPNPNPFNPADRYFGKPPLRSAARAISLDNAATDFVDRLLRNDATPTTVVTTEQAVTDALVERLRAKWFQRHAGQNRGGLAFLQKGMKVEALGLNLRDLEFPDLRTISESRVCMTMGRTPPILVGAKVGLDRSTFANYHEAVESWWNGPLWSLQRKFRDAFSGGLLPTQVGRKRVMLAWDNSEVPSLREGESARWERATNALARGGITRNDFREVVGLPPVPNGDVFLTPSGVLAEDSGVEPAGGALESVAAAYALTAAEFGIELSTDELAVLRAQHSQALELEGRRA